MRIVAWWNDRTDRKLERRGVSPEAVALMRQAGLGRPNWFIGAADAAPYYPPSVRKLLERAEREGS